MDPLSQAALGAVVGQLAGHRRLGARAAVAGAVAGAFPDIDVFLAADGDPFDYLLVHRGLTHSLLFAPVAGPVAGALIGHLEARRAAREPESARRRRRAWMGVITLALLSHPLLDLLTPYGTQLLLPLSQTRYAINAMPIIDPLYTLILLLGLLAATTRWRRHATRVAAVTLLLSGAWLGHGWALNSAAEHAAARQLAAEGVTDARVAAFPTLFQLHYRRLVARTPEEDRVGFISMWRPCTIHWTRVPRQPPDPSVDRFLATREGRIFDWFTMGWARYRLEHSGEGRVLHATDLRYGISSDPDQSIFSASAALDMAGRLAGPVRAGGQAVEASTERLMRLIRDTYAPECAAP